MSCRLFIILSLAFLSQKSFTKDYLIYSIDEEIPMGEEGEVVKKNYFINIGQEQGVELGTKLSVFRMISKLNPYDNQKMMNHKIKVGEIEVLYSGKESSIGRMLSFYESTTTPLFEIEDFMIGDYVDVSIDD